ncbi:MAG: UDP-N-acetylmuramoyl-tripeptide--D-alanyl-D-alanine ligase [Lysobacteraceae bacterium]
MRPLMLEQVARWCGARLLGVHLQVVAVCTDSRAVVPGSLFVALKGERFDGHEHAAAAVEAGAAAVLVQRRLDLEAPQLLCADTQAALGDLAAGIARGRPATVLALTGSNGKTTVKTLLASILAGVGPTHANPGNRNNEIGLPLAVIEAPEDARFAIYEMGAGKPGDIAYLTAIARPDIALVNNIGPAHLERMGTLAGIAETKGAIYEALPADGTAVINADDAFCEVFARRAAGRRIIRFGLEGGADVRALAPRLAAESTAFVLRTPAGEVAVELPLPGEHNLRNALAAAAMALAAGATPAQIAAGLGEARPVAGRQVVHAIGDDVRLIDDSYNANPASVAAAIDTLAKAGGEGWLVLGDMGELGPSAELLHAEVGDRARRAGLSRVFTIGTLSRAASRAFGDGGEHFQDQAALLAALRERLAPGVRCLVKGSRSAGMERVVKALLDSNDDPGEASGHAA